MKRQLFLMAVLAFATAAHANEDNDTTIIDNARRVMVITTDSLQKIKVIGKDKDDKYVYENSIQLVDTNYVSEQRTYRDLRALDWSVGKDRKDWHVHTLSLHLGLGVSAPTHAPAGYGFAPFKSWEGMLWLMYHYTPYRRLQTYSVGFGLTTRMYGLHSSQMVGKDDADVVSLTDYPEGAGSVYSKINVASLSVPLLFTQKLGRKSHVSLSLGPVLNFNVSASLRSGYKLGDSKYDIETSHIGQRPVTVDFMGVVRVYGVGAYFKFSPQSVFKTGRGPEFRSLSFGLYF